MSKQLRSGAGTAALLLLLSACNGGTGDVNPSSALGFDPAELDPATAPADDFFDHVNGPWLAATEIPAYRSSFGAMQILADDAELQLRDIVDELRATPGPAGSDAQKLSDLYDSFMDTRRVEELGTSPLNAELERIDAIADQDALVSYFGRALRLGLKVPLDFYTNLSLLAILISATFPSVKSANTGK